MNFFQAQENARRNTGRLAILFTLAVITLVVLTNLLVAFVYLWTQNTSAQNLGMRRAPVEQLLTSLPWESWALISMGVVGVVAVACAYKYLSLKGGGKTIAEALGGTRISQSTTDYQQRRLLNVVEEMAIASGTPVPPVYLIPEPSINAFAAGHTIDDAVIGINQGTLDYLDRDELQGVIAHEFSHVLNGDMGINLRLIAILHGILFIGMIGYGVLRGTAFGHRGRSNNSGLPIMVLAVGLLVIGYGGTFFGNLIKAAVSRQREYLADAASVQFTRNPSGIAEALKKIGGLTAGSTMTSPAAEQASHMFFGEIKPRFFSQLMGTHPPLEKRIRAIEPNWNGRFALPTTTGADRLEPATLRPTPEAAAMAGFAAGMQVDTSAAELVEKVGELDDAAIENAVELIATTDVELRNAAHDAWGCRALIYAMVLDRDPDTAERQFKYLQQQAENGVPELVVGLRDAVAQLDGPHRITLIELAIPTLKELSNPQYRRFMHNVTSIIRSDRQVELMEWVLHRVLVKELSPHFDGPRRSRARFGSLDGLETQVVELVSAIARHGHPDDARARQHAVAAGLEDLGFQARRGTPPDPNYSRLSKALAQLRELKPLVKPKLLKACAAAALADDHLTADEGALLHGIAATLDCPLPPSIYTRSSTPKRAPHG